MSCASTGRTIYRIFDSDPQGGHGVHPVEDFVKADEWNEQKWGIFWTVNQFPFGERRKDKILKILSWAVDMDEGTKEEQRERIRKFVKPSMVVETKSGFHVYYNALNATLGAFAGIMERLIFNLEGDPRAKDLCRILRVPGSLHWKDAMNPFPIVARYDSTAVYTEDEMLAAFPPNQLVVKQKLHLAKELKFQNDGELFDKIWNLDCEAALQRLSGKTCVGFETFEFVSVSRGHMNILVNGKSTSCFIDSAKRIGSTSGGGPTIWQWIQWYQKDHKKTHQAVREHFPELFDFRSLS